MSGRGAPDAEEPVAQYDRELMEYAERALMALRFPEHRRLRLLLKIFVLVLGASLVAFVAFLMIAFSGP